MTASQSTTPTPTFARWLGSHRPAGIGLPDPGDLLVRLVFGRPEHAATYLSDVLPPGLKDQLGLEDMAPVPASLLHPRDRRRYSGVLFTFPRVHEQVFAHLVYCLRGSRHADRACERARRAFIDSYEQFTAACGQAGCAPERPRLITLALTAAGGHDA